MKLRIIYILLAFVFGQALAGYAEANCGVLPVPPAGCEAWCQCDSRGLNCQVVMTCRL